MKLANIIVPFAAASCTLLAVPAFAGHDVGTACDHSTLACEIARSHAAQGGSTAQDQARKAMLDLDRARDHSSLAYGVELIKQRATKVEAAEPTKAAISMAHGHVMTTPSLVEFSAP